MTEGSMNSLKISLFLLIFFLWKIHETCAMEQDSKQERETRHTQVSKKFNPKPNKPVFSYKKSTYAAEHWDSFDNTKLPYLSESDWLAFNVVRITTGKVSYKEGNSQVTNLSSREYFQEVSTGFLIWSPYVLKNPLSAISKSYKETKTREPLLITCQHCVKEWPKEEEIELYEFNIHYVDPLKRQFYLMTIKLPNIEHKVHWIFGDRDISVLQVGKILQEGKEKLDEELKSNFYPFFKAIDLNEPLGEERNIGYLSDVTMYGYPYELSASNSLPLARFGHCSTDPKQSIWETSNDPADFYIDMASISGSSGSPVWFYFKTHTGELNNDEVTIKAELEQDEVEKEGEELKLTSTNIEIQEATLDDKEVEIEEKIQCTFAGMFFEGPEFEDNDVNHHTNSHRVLQDIHLGRVLNRKSVFSFVNTLKEDDPTKEEVTKGKDEDFSTTSLQGKYSTKKKTNNEDA